MFNYFQQLSHSTLYILAGFCDLAKFKGDGAYIVWFTYHKGTLGYCTFSVIDFENVWYIQVPEVTRILRFNGGEGGWGIFSYTFLVCLSPFWYCATVICSLDTDTWIYIYKYIYIYIGKRTWFNIVSSRHRYGRAARIELSFKINASSSLARDINQSWFRSLLLENKSQHRYPN